MATAKKSPVPLLAKKRVYSRKPKAVAAAVPTASASTDENPTGIRPVVLTDVQYLNMTDIPYFFKAQMLALLESQNYIWAGSGEPIFHTPGVLEINILKFNHTNKLVYPICNDCLPADALVSHVEGELTFNLNYSEPASLVPNVIRVGDAEYLRIK